jgi:hypothetical protein
MNGLEQHAHDLFGDRLLARDGEVGRLRDLYFDDRHWTIRYLVVDTRRWPAGGRRVLVPPRAVLAVSAPRRRLEVDLTRAQVLGSPDIDTQRPVSRQHEVAVHEHYGIPFDWAHDTVLDDPPTGDPHLRSMRDVSGYTVRTGDAPVGHVADFVVDTHLWTVAALVVAARHWPHGGRARVAIEAVERLSWLARSVYVDRNAVVIHGARTA